MVIVVYETMIWRVTLYFLWHGYRAVYVFWIWAVHADEGGTKISEGLFEFEQKKGKNTWPN